MKKIKLFSIFSFAFLLLLGKSFGQTSPNFPACKCGNWKVLVGTGKPGDNGKLNIVKNGDLIEYQQGEIIALQATMNCTSSSKDNFCATCNRTVYQVLDENGKTFIDWQFGELPKEINTDKFECDKVYTLTLQGQCGCTTCEPFVVKFKKKCCDCSKLKDKPLINGISCLCWKKGCKDTLTYTTISNDTKCYKYEWAVSPSVKFTGQGTNQISFGCQDVKPGNIYTITVTIRCGNTVVSNSYSLNVCERLDPTFTMSSNSADVTVSSSLGGTHYWFLVKEIVTPNCQFDNGEPYVSGSGASYTFTGLVDNQQYMIYHLVFNYCDNGCGCFSSKIMCFKWLPSLMKSVSGGGGKKYESISENFSEDVNKIPQAFKKEIPRDLWMSKKPLNKQN